jgi:alanyl-tRNA synthetase
MRPRRGKHNDLDNVGYRPPSHFLRDAGEFLLRRLFQEDAITFAWDFVSKVIGLPKDKLLVTIYPTDDQARQLWKKIAGFSMTRSSAMKAISGRWAPPGHAALLRNFYDQGPS